MSYEKLATLFHCSVNALKRKTFSAIFSILNEKQKVSYELKTVYLNRSPQQLGENSVCSMVIVTALPS